MNALTIEPEFSVARGALGRRVALAAENPTSILLIEDHPFFCDGISSAIRQFFPSVDLQVAVTAAAAMPLLGRRVFDLVFLDVNLPDKNGFELLDEINARHILQPVVILTGIVTYRIAGQAQRKGAIGAISKSITLPQLHRCCLQLLQGEMVFQPDASLQCTGDDKTPAPTTRELQVLSKLEEGLDNAEICTSLSVSDSTLRTHLRNLFSKLDVSNRTACLVQAKRLGWM